MQGDTYAEMVDTIPASVRLGSTVCAAFYGHPGVFVNPGHAAVRQARREGYPAVMLPGISAENCLFADLGLDPGCQPGRACGWLAGGHPADPGDLPRYAAASRPVATEIGASVPLVRLIVAVVLLAIACGGSEGTDSSFHSLSVDDADLGLRLETVSISSDHVDDFHRHYGTAREIDTTDGFTATDGTGYVLQLADTAGAANPTDGVVTRSIGLAWERAPFAGIVVNATTSMTAADPAEFETHAVLGAGECRTVTAWDLWHLDPAPDPMIGRIEILKPTIATLATTIVIDSTDCP